MKIDAILSPAELPALAKRDLRGTVCVVFDVLRATSTFVTALHHGAKAIVPVSEIAEALALRQRQPDVLLGGERDGVKICTAQTGGGDFDLGNSPREYTPEIVRGRTIVSTTTNGTRALRACAGAKMILAASFLNLTATAKFLRQFQPGELLLVCAGTRENMADEDVLAAGALYEILDVPLAPPSPGLGGERVSGRMIRSKPPATPGGRRSSTCLKLFRRRKTRGGCWPFPNCAMTWRFACNGTFSTWSPRWAAMGRFGFQFEPGTPRARSFASILASPGLSRNASS